jgi:DNA-binding NarL/FixJ family response regulator/signal transduction histidine kinase
MSDEERAASRQAAAEHGRWRGEVVAYRKDGTPVSVELITVAVHGELGEITGYLGIHRDVTDHKRAEERLRASHRQIETILESIADAFVALDREWRYTYLNDRALGRVAAWKGSAPTRQEILGKSIFELFPELVGSEIDHRLRDAMGGHDPVEFEIYFAPTDEWVEARAYPSPTGLSIYFRNVSERRRGAEDRERSARRHAVIAELGLRALASYELEALMDEAAAVCARMLDVELVGIHELLAGGDQLVLRAGFGWHETAVGSATTSAGRGSLMGFTLIAEQPVMSEDVAQDARFAGSALLANHDAVGALCVVIEGHDAPFGTLAAFSTRTRSFSAVDLDFVQAIANVLAAAVERSNAEQRLTEVRDVERRRIARDLHDEALQDLNETLAQAAAARGGPDEAEDRLAQVVPALKRIGVQLRGAVYDLRLGGEENRSFRELLAGLVDVQRALADGEVHLSIGDGVPAGPLGRRGTEVLRIVGEAIINARRHADARNIRVDVSGSARRLRVEISDDGRGFDTEPPPGATGINGMRERSALLDGDLHIASRLGAGTRVRCDLPLTSGVGEAEQEVRILLVEDHAAVREAIAAVLEREPDFRVVGQAPTLAEAREKLRDYDLDVDVAVVDLGLPDGDGADLIRNLREANPRAQALILTASLDRARSARAIESGAAAILDKTAHLDEIVDAVRRLRAGETLLSRDAILELLHVAGRQRERERADREAIARLTPREREVLQALGDGLDSQAIAQRLAITVRTQRNHVASILAKLGVHSQLQAVLFALRYGVIEVR